MKNPEIKGVKPHFKLGLVSHHFLVEEQVKKDIYMGVCVGGFKCLRLWREKDREKSDQLMCVLLIETLNIDKHNV